MAHIIPASLETDTPRSTDGRSYPDHLRRFEAHDDQLLGLLSEIQPATFDELSVRVGDPRLRAVLLRWLASAEWRGLIERTDATATAPRSYVLSERGSSQLQARGLS